MASPETTTKLREVKRLHEARRRQRHAENGLCTACNNPAYPNKTHCLTCITKANIRYHKNKDMKKGFCADCEIPLERNNRWLRCPSCRENTRARQAASRKKRKARGRCAQCGNVPPAPNRTACSDCLTIMSERVQAMKQKRIERGTCYRCSKDGLAYTPRYKGNHRVCETCYFRIKANSILGRESLWRILRDKLIAQNYICPYTGETIVLGVNDSIDHILPIAHYPLLAKNPANLEWVTFRVNLAKRDLTKHEFVELIQRIASNLQLTGLR